MFPGATSPFQPFVTVSNVSVDNPGASLGGNQQAAITVTTIARDFKPPQAWDWNFTVQREVPWHSVLEVGYVGHRGLNLPQVYDINQPLPGTVVSGVNVNYVRPYKGFAAIQMEESVATSMYNALQVSWNRRFNNGFSFGFAYTLSKSMDSGSNYRDIVPDTYNASNMWGPSEFDSRHVVVFNYVYSLPFFKDKSTLSGKLLGGWQISGSNQFQTGTPCGVFGTNDVAQVGEVGSLGCGQTTGQFYNLNGTPAIVGQFAGGAGAASPNQYFVTTNSSGAPLFHRARGGNVQSAKRACATRSYLSLGFQDWRPGSSPKEVRDHRKAGTAWSFSELRRLDVNNHPNWGNVMSFNPTSSVFGKVTTKTNLSRNLQLSLRYAF